jgi:hypothetical protein
MCGMTGCLLALDLFVFFAFGASRSAGLAGRALTVDHAARRAYGSGFFHAHDPIGHAIRILLLRIIRLAYGEFRLDDAGTEEVLNRKIPRRSPQSGPDTTSGSQRI